MILLAFLIALFLIHYNMSAIHEININSEGLVYVNANLKIHALLLTLARRNAANSQALLERARQCETQQCLAGVEGEWGAERARRQELEGAVGGKEQAYVYDYILCGDLVFDNDIKVCRRKVKQHYLEQLAALVQGHL